MRGPLSDAEKAKIDQLFAEGMGRNAIARELNRDWSAISRYARKNGMSFAREDALLGVEARRRVAAERRAELALALLDDVERMCDQLFAPTKYVQYVGKDGIRAEDTLPEPTAADKRNLAQSAMALLDRSVKLDEYDRAGGPEGARMFLGQLWDSIMGPDVADTAGTTPKDPGDAGSEDRPQ